MDAADKVNDAKDKVNRVIQRIRREKAKAKAEAETKTETKKYCCLGFQWVKENDPDSTIAFKECIYCPLCGTRLRR
jgi:hypothetical protein